MFRNFRTRSALVLRRRNVIANAWGGIHNDGDASLRRSYKRDAARRRIKKRVHIIVSVGIRVRACDRLCYSFRSRTYTRRYESYYIYCYIALLLHLNSQRRAICAYACRVPATTAHASASTFSVFVKQSEFITVAAVNTVNTNRLADRPATS